jgi:hypothetical protein
MQRLLEQCEVNDIDNKVLSNVSYDGDEEWKIKPFLQDGSNGGK